MGMRRRLAMTHLYLRVQTDPNGTERPILHTKSIARWVEVT
jgi:hypothetical protein